MWHASEPWSEGRRVLLVAYNLKRFSKPTPEQVQLLSELGFPGGASFSAVACLPEAAFEKGGRLRHATKIPKITKITKITKIPKIPKKP